MGGSYSPLSDHDSRDLFPASMDVELRLARECVAKAAAANIHDHQAMIRAAVSLDHRLRTLIAAIEAERGGAR